MKKTVSILGSTGSIGTQALSVIQRLGFTVGALSAYKNIDLLEKQIRLFHPKLVSVYLPAMAERLKQRIQDTDTVVVSGQQGNCAVASFAESDIVITSMVGMIGLKPTIAAIQAGKDIALANKETLVCAGRLVIDLAKENNVHIYPVDSEHSAIFQCLQGNRDNKIKYLWLTASGGPFRGYTAQRLKTVTKEQALKHPNWSMGAKITIDSATMMNKGLEVIEAKWLFDVDADNIKVAVHPQSIVHSMVQYEDNAVMAQMGVPSMEIPIQYALTFPKRLPTPDKTLSLDLFQNDLHFERPDTDVFESLTLCRKALQRGGLCPCVVNGANEAAVDLFLSDKIEFYQIIEAVKRAFYAFQDNKDPYTLEDVLQADVWAREFVYKNFG